MCPQDNAATKKTIRQPPVYTISTNINSLINTITATDTPKSTFLIKEISKENHIIYTQSAVHYKAITDVLLEKKIQYFTYTPKELKPKSILLKGIRGNFDIEEIKQEILNLNTPGIEITNLSKFVFDKSQPDKFHHLLQLSHNSNTKELFKIKTIAFQRVRWEHLRRPAIFQCRKCQRLGHASKNCFLQYRCVKCANTHEPGKCPITKENDRLQLKCANCGQEGHPASYKGCPYIKFAMDQKKQSKTAKIHSSLRSINNIAASIRSDTTFAQATARGVHGYPPLFTPKKPSPTPITPEEAGPSSYSRDHHHHQTYQQSTTQPPWVIDLKKELSELVTDQFKTLAARVAENAHKIDFILSTLHSE